MALCDKCGTEGSLSAKFCAECGHPFPPLSVDIAQAEFSPKQITMETPTSPHSSNDAAPSVGEVENAQGAGNSPQEARLEGKSNGEPEDDHPPKKIKVLAIFVVVIGGAVVAAVLGYFLSGRRQAPQKPILRLHASGLIGRPLVQDLAKEFLKRIEGRMDNPAVTEIGGGIQVSFASPEGMKIVEVQLVKDSHAALDNLGAGNCDIGLSWREMNYGESKKIDAANQDAASPSTFAYCGIAVIVNPQNPINLLSKEEVKKIFTGEIDHWGQFSTAGGGKIKVFAPDDDSEIYSLFEKKILTDKETITGTAGRFEDSFQVMAKVIDEPDGIGLIDVRSITNRVKKITVTQNEDMMPSVNDPSYQSCNGYLLCQPLFMYIRNVNERYSLEFKKFINSEDGSRVLSKHNLFAAFSKPRIATQYGAECDEAIKGARPILTFTGLFSSGSWDLDGGAQRLLQEVMESRRGEGYSFIVLGFADIDEPSPNKQSSEKYNKQLSENRAATVWQKLNEQGFKAVYKGCGVLASGGSEDEKSKNRRVEIWFR